MAENEKTPHWDTPYGTAKPGEGKKKAFLVFVFVGVIVLLVAMGAKVVGDWQKKRADQAKAKDGDPSAQIKDLESGEKPKDKTVSATALKLKDELKNFGTSHAEYIKRLAQVRGLLKKRRPQLDASYEALQTAIKAPEKKLQLQAAAREFKSLKSEVKALEAKETLYEGKAAELKSYISKIERDLESAEILGEDAVKEQNKLLALSRALIKDVEEQGTSLNAKVEEKPADDDKVKIDLDELKNLKKD